MKSFQLIPEGKLPPLLKGLVKLFKIEDVTVSYLDENSTHRSGQGDFTIINQDLSSFYWRELNDNDRLMNLKYLYSWKLF